MMGAFQQMSMLHPIAFDAVSVPVELAARGHHRVRVPRADKLNKQSDSERRKNAIGPDHLRRTCDLPIITSLLFQACMSENTKTPQARAPGRRENNLSAKAVTVISTVNVHPEVNIGD
jgi:hypothetical protein